LLTGPGVTSTVDMEGTANAGQVVVSAATAAELPASFVGVPQGEGFRLRRLRSLPEPDGEIAMPYVADLLELSDYVPTAIRAHLLSGGEDAEHRQATVAFLHFDGTDEMVAEDGPGSVAVALEELVCDVQRASDEHAVTFLSTDIDHDGGKIILVA